MPDDSGPAYPTVFPNDPSPGVTRRLWLAAHAPPMPDGWAASRLERHHETGRQRRGEGEREPKPTALDLDHTWRFAWADGMLERSERAGQAAAPVQPPN